jgi:deoxyribodipyrimidine photolyase-related protein
MERFIDAYDWVMVPNVYSMALYADGGIITTKPYISGSSYIVKMSDFKKGKKGDLKSWDIIWDALFWNFVGMHYEKLSQEGRLGFIGIQYRKMSQEKKKRYTQIAKEYIATLS